MSRKECGPVGIFKVAGVLPTNFPSTKISAASGSEVIVIWPNPSGEEDEAGNETVDSETAVGLEDGELVASWESEGWPADSAAVAAGGTERAG